MTASLLFAGCTGTVSGEVTTPSMVYIDSDVRVVADYDEPIFYTDRYYWRQSGGVWYRSSRHSGGWAVYAAPSSIRRIERPSAYVRYRGTANVNHDRRPAVRDHRDNRRPSPPVKHKKEDKKKDHDRRDHKD